MAASELIAAAIAAFSIGQLSPTTLSAEPSDVRCLALLRPARAIAVAQSASVRPWTPGLADCRGAGAGSDSLLAALVAAVRDWLDDADWVVNGTPHPRALVYVKPLADPADADPVRRMIRETIDDVHLHDPMVALDRTQLGCLQRALYFEARGEGERGMAAVAHVALNRVGTKSSRATVCDVVREPGQFAPYLTGEPDEIDLAETDEDAAQLAIEIAAQVMAGYLPDPSRGGRYFYAPAVLKVVPEWAKGMKETARVGGHRFFAEPPAPGTRVAVRN
jgi:hypothetical protein